ncbi:probable sodium-coupled neutral amino acid transporter 6 [Brachionichthys hirsutus]|uniref:probable sodium-coupled neutral amino acid transporter 6 n=1 Tax=Brachionichthys hirsutus TaxID=412623 RepID=UPI00360440CD
MSMNGTTNRDSRGGCINGDSESNETSPILENDSAPTRVKGASFASCVFNMMNAIMGSGILGLAYSMAGTGIVFFCMLLTTVSTLASYSIHLLLKLCDQTGMNSYEDLGGRAFQKAGKTLVGIMIIIQNIGGVIFYLEIDVILFVHLEVGASCSHSGFLGGRRRRVGIKDAPTPTGVEHPQLHAWYEDGRVVLIIVTLCVVLPLSMLTKIGFLGYTSSFAFFCVLYFVVVIVVKKWSIPCPLPQNVTTLYYSFQVSNDTDSECTPSLFVVSSKSAFAIPTMAFSFLCHTAVLPIYCELDKPTKSRMQNVTNVSIALSFLLYLISAVFGYLTFYAHVESELLLSYDAYLPRDVMVMTVRLAILSSVLLTVPLVQFPARKAVTLLLFGGRPFSWLIHVTTTLSILGVVLLLAIFVPDIRQVFGVVGSTTSSCLLFVFPGILYLKLNNRSFRAFDSIGAVILVVFGLMMGLLSLSVIIVSWTMTS